MKQKKNLLIFSSLAIILNICLLVIIFFNFTTNSTASKSDKTLLKIDKNYSLLGTSSGLYYSNSDKLKKIWDGSVKKIVTTPLGYFFNTDRGILFSQNLSSFELRNKGIQEKRIKDYTNGQLSFFSRPEDLKDLSFDPYNPKNLITNSKNGVYVSQNNGVSWTFYRNQTQASGITCVAIYSYNKHLYIFFGHPYKGVYYRDISLKNSRWVHTIDGLNGYGGYREEISNIIVVKNKNQAPSIMASQNFSPYIYKLSSNKKKWSVFVKDKNTSPVTLIESLQLSPHGNLLYMNNDDVVIYSKKKKSFSAIKSIKSFVEKLQKNYNIQTQALSVFKDKNLLYSLDNLWILRPPVYSEYKQKAMSQNGLYTQTDVFHSSKRFSKILSLSKELGINMFVIDMKDDFGHLRFRPSSPSLRKISKPLRPLHLESTLKRLKKAGIYTVARIPVFKDKVLFSYGDRSYAIKDRKTGKPWRGIKKYVSGRAVYNKEFWVDPYYEKVWEYNIKIAKELISKGFDEIQFDYIRFPTDGKNLRNTYFSHRAHGMDKESALISFLRYARANIKAPISIDIYGANGWLRTGARTGQDVEMLKHYVDVISPMYYPSHFGAGFLNTYPHEQRPYRIYHIGSYRNYYIAHKEVIIRPYVQSFMLHFNKYDRKYYNKNYINRELEGIANSTNMGYTFWNSATHYNILLQTELKK